MAGWKTIVVLLVLAAGLGGFFYYDTYWLNPQREKAESAKGRIWTVEPKDVEAVTLVRTDGTVRLKRSGDGWEMLEPVKARGDRSVVDDLVTTLATARMGLIARNVFGRRVLARIEMLFDHVPIFRSIYPSVKQLLESFSPQKRHSFKAVVLAEHPRKGEYVFGFVTSELLIEGVEGKRQMVTVFVPTNNLYLGDVIVVPKEDTLPTGLTVEEGIRIILSAGTATPSRLPRERL